MTVRQTPTGEKRAALKDRGDDLYQTPPQAVYALLEVENLPHQLWEPACGPGNIAHVLRDAGRQVYASDLVDYNSPDQDRAGVDFLMECRSPIGTDAIITNPPFKLAGEFVAHALELCPRVVMLLRLAFLESDKRTPILDGGMLERVYVFRNRLPMMHREGWEGPRSTSTIPFAWFMWNRAHCGPWTGRRLSWREPCGKTVSRLGGGVDKSEK